MRQILLEIVTSKPQWLDIPFWLQAPQKCYPLTQTLKSSSYCINLLFRVKADWVGLSAFGLQEFSMSNKISIFLIKKAVDKTLSGNSLTDAYTFKAVAT